MKRTAAAREKDPRFLGLREMARGARERAYAPYSQFQVGAALETLDGRAFAGCNVENASYGLTMCAERNAVFQAVASGGTRIRTVVVYTESQVPTPPCGACRQVIREFGPDAIVHATTATGLTRTWTMDELLPGAFGPDDLRRG